MPTAPLRTPEPYEAKHLPEITEADGIDDAVRNLFVAVNGFAYVGEANVAVQNTIKFLRANPDYVSALFPREAS